MDRLISGMAAPPHVLARFSVWKTGALIARIAAAIAAPASTGGS